MDARSRGHSRMLPHRRLKRTRSRAFAVLVVLACAAVLPVLAFATTSTYWGYDWLSKTNPGAGACYYNTGASGIACANTSADSATLQKTSGSTSDIVANTFQNGNIDYVHDYVTDTISALSSTGHDPAQAPTCYHPTADGSSYVQCRYTQSGGN
jgi:hypothetical protein